MTLALEKAFDVAARLSGEEQDGFASFILEELAFRTAVRQGIDAANRRRIKLLKDVKAMIPKLASK